MSFCFLIVPLNCTLISEFGQQCIQAFELHRLVNIHRLEDLCSVAQSELRLLYLHFLEGILDLRRVYAERLVDQLHYPLPFVPLVGSELLAAFDFLGLVSCLAAGSLARWFCLGIFIVACLLGAGLLQQRRRRQGMHAFDHLYLLQCLERSNGQRIRLILIVLPSVMTALVKHRVLIRRTITLLLARVHLRDCIRKYLLAFLHLPL